MDDDHHSKNITLTGLGGSMKIFESILLPIMIEDQLFGVFRFAVVPNLPVDCIWGLDILKGQATLDLSNNQLKIKHLTIKLTEFWNCFALSILYLFTTILSCNVNIT